MAIVHFPYGRTELTADLPDEDLAAVLTAQLPACGDSEGALVRRALDNPIGAPRLCELARGKKKVVVLLSDHTRPVPSRAILPPMLEEIRRGNPAAEITLLVATGCHRATAPEELREKLGPELYAREKIVVHDCDDEANLVCLGTLPSGGALVIHRLAAEADLLVAEGFIEPHFLAGARACSRASRGAKPCLRTTARPSSTIRGRARACSRATRSTGTWSGRRGGRGSPSSSTP